MTPAELLPPPLGAASSGDDAMWPFSPSLALVFPMPARIAAAAAAAAAATLPLPPTPVKSSRRVAVLRPPLETAALIKQSVMAKQATRRSVGLRHCSRMPRGFGLIYAGEPPGAPGARSGHRWGAQPPVGSPEAEGDEIITWRVTWPARCLTRVFLELSPRVFSAVGSDGSGRLGRSGASVHACVVDSWRQITAMPLEIWGLLGLVLAKCWAKNLPTY